MALTFDVRVGDLNWLFLVYAVAVVVVILFYLFYFGRLLASIISIVLRTVLWRRFKVWLDIGSIQFSPLGGRLLFRDVRYVGENQTITIAMGSITWRYWLWKVRQDDDLRRGQLGDTLFTVALLMSATEDSRLPCRTSIKLEGAEWFIYNRNAAFDMLLDHLSRRDKAAARSASTSDSETNEKGAARILPPSNENHMNQDPDVIDWFRESLPLELNVIKGAIVMGNRSTPSLIVAGFRSAVGTCGAVKSRSMHDFYKQIYQFTFSTPRILFRKNHDFEESMLAHGAHMQQNQDATVNQKLDGSTLQRGAFAEILRKCTTFAELVYNPSSRAERKKKDQAAEWHGLARYREAVENLYSTKAAEVGSDRQYGKVSTVYDNGDSIDLTYYADVAGYVPEGRQKPHSFSNLDKPDIGNGDLSPEWGVDIRLNGGTLTYGPWADRQRVAIQNAFFPPAYFDTEITQSLRAGDRRLHTALKIFMDFSQTTTFRLPSREASKDWKYDGKDPVMDTSRRPYGWLDMALGPDSSFTFVLPMIAGATGYETFLEIHLDSLMIYSSVNYEKFLEAKSCRVSCQLPQPLAWDARHDWNISVTVERPEVFFLRDHAYLLTDMVRDWTAGDPPDYQRFVPFTYTLKLAFNDYKLYLYLNERNIVNNPSVIEDNTLLLITGPKLAVDMMVPSDQYRPLYTKMTTQLEAGNISLSMLAPASNTHQAWLTSRTEVFGKVDTLRCSISHMMFAEGHSNNVETLDINLEMNGVLFEALGWVIKYFIEVKDNYFGAYNNFTTTAEADLERNKVSRHNALNPLQRKHDLCPPDVFEVNLEVVSRNGVILFPEEVHDCKSGLVLNIPEVGVHLRNHDYYMELLINVDPLTMVFSDKLESVIMAHSVPASTNHNRVILDGMTIAAHRLFGPQPLTSTYVAMWSFGLGHLAADLTIPHFASLQRIARAFVSNFLDEDNTLHDDDAVMPLPDVTFLSATLRSIDVNVWSRDSAVNLAVPLGLSIHFNDHVSRGSLTRIEVTAPSIQARGLVHSQANQWSEVTSCDLSLSITATTSSTDWEARELTQKRFLATQDLLTARCSFLYEDGSLTVDQVHSRLGSLFNIPLDAVHDLASFQLDSTPSQSWKVERRKHKVSSRSDKTEDSDFSSLSYGSLLRVFRLIPSGVLTTNQTNVFQPIGDIPEEQRRTRRYSRSVPVANAYSPSNESERFTRIHAEMERTVRLMCSPKAVKVAEDVVATLEQNYEPEHWIDELDDRFRKALPVQVDPDRHESFRASLSIRAVSLMLVQDVLRPGDLDLPEALDGNISPDASILCTAHLSIRNIEASALSVQAFKVKDGLDSQAHHDLFMNSRYRSAGGAPIDPVIKTKEIAFHTGKLRLGVKHVSPNTSETSHAAPTVAGLPSASSGTVLEAFVNGLDAYAELPDQYQRFSVRLLDSGVNAVSSAAELVTGTVHSWFIVSRAIEKAVFHAHYRPVSSYRRLVTDILQFAHREEIVTDPLFLNRPTAAAVHLRSNTDWKIMAHVRHVLRRLSEASRRQLQGSFRANVSAAEDFKNLVARLQEWHNWELDELVIRRLPLIQSLFRPVEFASALSQPDPHNEAESEGASAQATDLQLVIATRDFIVTYFEDGQCTNSLLLRPTELFAAQNTSEDAAAMVRLTIGPILLVLDPGILRLIVHISRVRRVFGKKLEPLIPRPFAERVSSSSSFADCSVPLRASIQLEAVEVSTRASGVRATLIVQGLCGFAALSVRKSGDRISATTSQVSITSQMVKMLTITEGALPTREGVKESTGTLISVQLEGFSSHATFDLVESAPNRYLHLLGMVASVRVRIPRSVLRMSQFFEQWRAESLPQTKVAFDALRRDVELQNSDFSEQLNNHDPKRKGEQKQNASSKLHLSLHLHLPVLSFHIRAAQKFWLDYSIGRMALHGDGQVSNSEMSRAQCTLSLQSQTVDFIAVNDPRLQGEGAPFGGESIHFPAVLASVKYDGKEVKALATLERIAVTVTAGVLDSVFTVQKRFEHDIDEILSVFAKHKTKRKQAGAKQLEPLPLTEQRSLRWSGQLVLRGLNVGLKGPLSTQYIGADLVDGYVSHIPGEGQADTRWELHASNLALSLAQETAEDQITGAVHGIRKSSFDRTYRLAYFVLDIQAGNRVAEVEELKELTGEELIKDAQASHLHIKVGKVHAVMQTAAIEALDKLLEHFTSEIAQRRDARAQEFAAIKEKVIMTFDIQEKKNSTRVLPWIERCVLSVRINDVGIAIPLQDVEIDAPFFGHQLKPESKSRPAFLVSTPSLLFATSKASAGVADISDLSAQFVKTFDQTKPRDFAGYHHDTRNRLLLPSSGVKIATDAATASKAKAFTVNAKMSGTQLDIDGSIVQSVFRLLELYELSYKRLARHAPEVVGAADMTGFPKSQVETAEGSEPDLATFFDTTTFEATFQVESGVIRMHGPKILPVPASQAGTPAPPQKQHQEAKKPGADFKRQAYDVRGHTRNASTMDDVNAPQSFVIPKLSMWSVKKDSPGQGASSNLHFDALVHSSRNILQPKMLPFLSEVADALKAHMEKESPKQQPQESSSQDEGVSATPLEPSDVGNDAPGTSVENLATGLSTLRNLCISVSLRIDKSSLQLNCVPIAPVSAGLEWQSGGLVIVVQPGRRSLHASLSVAEVGFEIRHAYSPERCLTGAAQGLVLAFSLSPASDRRTLVSIEFDSSSINAEINFRQMHDFLCFKAVWLDRLEQIVPLPEGQVKPAEKTKVPGAQHSGVSMTTVVLARIQQVRFTCMLGHSIGTVNMTATMLLGRLRQIPMHSRSFSVDLQALELSSKGRLAGALKTDGLYFESYLHDIMHSNQAELQNCTSISAFIGVTDGSLEFDYRKTLLLSTEPIKLGVSDDWTKLVTDNELGLDFSLRFGSVSVIATTQTVPTLVKLGKDLEKLIEDRRAKTRALLLAHKATLPKAQAAVDKIEVKAVTEVVKVGAVLPSAIPEGTKVVGKIELEADRLRIAIFLHHFTDQEAFRADAGEVRAVLSRFLNEKKTVVRDLDLNLGFFSVKKMRPKQRVTPVQEREHTIQDWLDLLRAASDRNIFKFPTSQAHMASTQEIHTNRIHHRFSLVFTGQVDISLNYALLKQLGALLSAYHDGMKHIEDDEASGSAPAQAPEPTPLTLNGENGLESDIEGPAKRVLAANIPPPQSIDVVGSREYIALENNIQQPQLQLLGEATPPLEWLGLQRSHAPALVHEACTLILEHALLELSAVYRKSLSKAASIS